MAAAKQQKGCAVLPALTEGASRSCALAVLLEQPVFWWCLGPTP